MCSSTSAWDISASKGAHLLFPLENCSGFALATQLHSNLFGVVYVLDEPSAGLHPSDTESLMRALDALKRIGNPLFVVEHEIEVIKHADWLVDVGPAAGQNGGQILYSGPPTGLRAVRNSETAKYLFRTTNNNRSHKRREHTMLGWAFCFDSTVPVLHSSVLVNAVARGL